MRALQVYPQMAFAAPLRAEFLAYADATLAASHHKPDAECERVAGIGELVWRCVVPLELCKRVNASDKEPAWAAGKRKRNLYTVMRTQHGRPRAEPLPGRPLVRCVRFSSVEPDQGAGWEKAVIDVLTMPWRTAKREHRGLGLIREDRRECVQRAIWWEYAPKGRGFVLCEVWTGAVAS